MIRVFLIASVIVAIVLVVYLVMLMISMMRRAQWPGDSPQYRNHLGMARWIERQLRDDMVNVTIPPVDRSEAKKLLEEFYDAPQLGEGE